MEFVPQPEKETADEIAFDLVRRVISLGEVDQGAGEDPEKQRKNLVNG
jgi:hypothetical protein